MYGMKKLTSAFLTLAALFGYSDLAYAQQKLTVPYESGYLELIPEFEASGPKLIFSDSPEMVYKDGVLYRTTIEGDARIFFHHVNAVARKKKLSILLKNNQQEPVKYAVTRKGLAGPSQDWVREGKEAERLYFGKQKDLLKGELQPRRTKEITTGWGMQLKENEIYTGILDFHTDKPLEVSVLMCEPMTYARIYNEVAPVQPMDEHPLRGDFQKADWSYTLKKPLVPLATVPLCMYLADAEQGYIKGVDATTGKAAEDYGNYGVVYKLNFTVGGTKPVQFIFNPVGGYFAGYGVLVDLKKNKQKIIGMPEGKGDMGEYADDAIKLADLQPGQYQFIWSPPGASNLPVRFFWLAEEDQRFVKGVITQKGFKAYMDYIRMSKEYAPYVKVQSKE